MRFAGLPFLFVVFVSLYTDRTAWAQLSAPGSTAGITVSATESVPVKAERLRLVMIMKAKGADPKSAVMALSEHKQRVQKELEAMKAEKQSIEFTPSRLASEGNESNQMQQMQMRMQMQMGQPGAAVAKAAPPTVHTAVCAMKAEWALPSSDGDALALLPATLKEQIKARDLAGENNKPKLSKAAQEQLEELEGMVAESYSYSNSGEQQSLTIQFIAAIPEDAKKKAISAAFAKATKEADALAQSTGQKRGKLLSLTTDNPMSTAYAQMVGSFGGYYAQGDNPVTMMAKFADGRSVTSPNADDLNISVGVAVVYGIE